MTHAEQGPPIPANPEHQDWIERVSPTLYVRFTCGPDYERAFLCVEDGEPDMHDLATMSFKNARWFIEAYRIGADPTLRG